MIPRVKRLIRRAMPHAAVCYGAWKSLVTNEQSYLYTSGWMKSADLGYPCRPDGSELPWMNFSVVAFLEERLTTDLSMFEFGSGYSTVFYARRVRRITSVEHDQKWHAAIQPRLPANAEILLRKPDTDGEYCRTVSVRSQTYDVVVIDGQDRVNCIKQSLAAVTDRGVIVLDDSQRELYASGIAVARELGFLALSFEGLKPLGNLMERTTILYRHNNCLGL